MGIQDKDNRGVLAFRDPDGLLDEKSVMESIINSMSDGVLLIDRHGDIILANPALSNILGVEEERLRGSSWAELFLDDPQNQDFNQVIVDIIQEHICHYNRQVSYVTPEGRHKDLIATTTLMTAMAAGGEEEVSGVLVAFNDVSEIMELHRRESELLMQSRRLFKEKMESLDRLARAVAHEIRNPVTTIGGFASRLLDSLENEDSREFQYLRRILEGTQRLESVVREVRDYADLPSPRKTVVDLAEIVDLMLSRYRQRAADLKVRLAAEKETKGPVRVLADGLLLERVMVILLDNALDAMPQGGNLTVELHTAGDKASLVVADTGRGISPGDLPYLFDPFFTTKADAVGMSLAIAKRIALEHLGDLTAASPGGTGAVFTLILPKRPLNFQENDEKARQPNLK